MLRSIAIRCGELRHLLPPSGYQCIMVQSFLYVLDVATATHVAVHNGSVAYGGVAISPTGSMVAYAVDGGLYSARFEIGLRSLEASRNQSAGRRAHFPTLYRTPADTPPSKCCALLRIPPASVMSNREPIGTPSSPNPPTSADWSP